MFFKCFAAAILLNLILHIEFGEGFPSRLTSNARNEIQGGPVKSCGGTALLGQSQRTPCKIFTPSFPEIEDLTIPPLWDLLKVTGNKLEHDLQPPNKEVTLILGNIGSGKTTIAQILAGNANSLEVMTLRGDDTPVIIDPAGKIATTTASRTIIPELYWSPSNGGAYFDCPGFHDNRSPDTEIAVKFLLNKVTNYVNAVKLVFVVTYNSVVPENDRQEFDFMVTQAVKMVTNLAKLDPSIGLVVNKAHNYHRENGSFIPDDLILENTRSYLKMYKSNQESQLNQIRPGVDRALLQKKINFVDILLKTNRIRFIRVPKQCGPLSDNPDISETKQKLDKLITESLYFVPTVPQDFQYELPPYAAERIGRYLGDIDINIINAVSAFVEIFKREQAYHLLYPSKDVNQRNQIMTEDCGAFSTALSTIMASPNPNVLFVIHTLIQVVISRGYSANITDKFESELSRQGEYLDFFAKSAELSINYGHTLAWLQPIQTWVQDKQLCGGNLH